MLWPADSSTLSWDSSSIVVIMLAGHSFITIVALVVVTLVIRSSKAFSVPPHQKSFATRTTLLFETKNQPRHDVRSDGDGVMDKIDPEELKIQQALAEHQKEAPKLGWATDIRSLVAYNHGFAVMSTNSKS